METFLDIIKIKKIGQYFICSFWGMPFVYLKLSLSLKLWNNLLNHNKFLRQGLAM